MARTFTLEEEGRYLAALKGSCNTFSEVIYFLLLQHFTFWTRHSSSYVTKQHKCFADSIFCKSDTIGERGNKGVYFHTNQVTQQYLLLR